MKSCYTYVHAYSQKEFTNHGHDSNHFVIYPPIIYLKFPLSISYQYADIGGMRLIILKQQTISSRNEKGINSGCKFMPPIIFRLEFITCKHNNSFTHIHDHLHHFVV